MSSWGFMINGDRLYFAKMTRLNKKCTHRCIKAENVRIWRHWHFAGPQWIDRKVTVRSSELTKTCSLQALGHNERSFHCGWVIAYLHTSPKPPLPAEGETQGISVFHTIYMVLSQPFWLSGWLVICTAIRFVRGLVSFTTSRLQTIVTVSFNMIVVLCISYAHIATLHFIAS